jgi:hypothetical protein
VKDPQARWWEARRAQNRKPATYRCPLCGELLPALSEHMLLFPEGDHGRRRHAHTACVMQARAQGRLPTRDEWQRAQPGPQPGAQSRRLSLWRRLRGSG